MNDQLNTVCKNFSNKLITNVTKRDESEVSDMVRVGVFGNQSHKGFTPRKGKRSRVEKMGNGIKKMIPNLIPIKDIKFNIKPIGTRTLAVSHGPESSKNLTFGKRHNKGITVQVIKYREVIRKCLKIKVSSVRRGRSRRRPKIFVIIEKTLFNIILIGVDVT